MATAIMKQKEVPEMDDVEEIISKILRTGWSKEIWKGVCNNMASIRERNGKFNVIYSYTNEKGERKQKWETYETKAEAKRRKKEIEYKKEMGSFVVRKCKTLDELITEYVALYGKENWALSTYEGNVSLINNYILPIIGDTKLSEINQYQIHRKILSESFEEACRYQSIE